jgi:hypothetical protein
VSWLSCYWELFVVASENCCENVVGDCVCRVGNEFEDDDRAETVIVKKMLRQTLKVCNTESSANRRI